MKAIFPGQTPVPRRSETWILDLSHDQIWAIWLAGVRKFDQHHDRIYIPLPIALLPKLEKHPAFEDFWRKLKKKTTPLLTEIADFEAQ